MKNTKPSQTHSRPSNRRRDRPKQSTVLRLWIGLAIVCGLGLIAFVLLLKLLLPVLIAVSIVALGYWIWRSVQKHRQRHRRRQNRLNQQFYQLIKRQQGRVSALDFAMYAQIDGIAAQDYLNQQAQSFSAYCETTIQGDIVYVFNQAAMNQPIYSSPQQPNSHANAARAWAERTQAQRAYFEQKKAAWISAKQMNTLRQVSQTALNKEPIIPLSSDLNGVIAPTQNQPSLPSAKQTGTSTDASDRRPINRSANIEARNSRQGRSRQRKANANDYHIATKTNEIPNEKVVTIEVKAVRS